MSGSILDSLRGDKDPFDPSTLETAGATLRGLSKKSTFLGFLHNFPEQMEIAYGVSVNIRAYNDTPCYPDLHLTGLWPNNKFRQAVRTRSGGNVLEPDNVYAPADFFMYREELITDKSLEKINEFVKP